MAAIHYLMEIEFNLIILTKVIYEKTIENFCDLDSHITNHVYSTDPRKTQTIHPILFSLSHEA